MPQASSSSRDGGGHRGNSRPEEGASVPLLADDERDRPAPRDTRFAISEEDAEAADDDDAAAERLASAEGGNKYPPNSLPPSYRDAIFATEPWYKSEVALSLQHYGRACMSNIGPILKKYWPTSRFAQAGFFIVGLWIIVIVSGPTWDKSSRLGWEQGGDDFLASIPPPPLNGDGHFLSLADWSIPSCRSTPGGQSTYCTRRSDFKLAVPAAVNSWASSDKIFAFVDPIRGHRLSDGRGRVPATVEILSDGTTPGEVAVEVQARYEKEVEPLLQRANVGLMAAGLRDRGIGIYTWPLPAHLRNVPPSTYPYPLLSFKIIMHVSPEASIPNLVIDGANVDAGIFSALLPDSPLNKGKLQLLSRSVDNSPSLSIIESDRLRNARIGHAIGKYRAERSLALQKAREERSASTVFGILRVTVGEGDLHTGEHIIAHGRVWLVTGKGNIEFAESTNLEAIELHVETQNGGIEVGQRVHIATKDIVYVLSSKGGDIRIQDGVTIAGTRVTAEARAGRLVSEGSTWMSNHTLVLNGAEGLSALAGVSPPIRRELGIGTEQHKWVSVEAESRRGDVKLHFTEHVRNTPLRTKIAARQGSAEVGMHREYAGSFHVQATDKASTVTPPSEGAGAPAVDGRDRVFSSQDDAASSSSNFDRKGEVWWREHGKSTQHLEGEDWGSVGVQAGKTARLSFDG